MVVIGIILLLPGLCSLIFVFGGLVKSAEDLQFVLALGLVGCAGVGLIWWAFGMMIVIGYFFFLFRTFKGKVAAASHE